MTGTEVPVQAQLDAYNAQDVERFVACYAEDVEAFELPAGTRLFASRAAMRTRYAALFAAHPRLRVCFALLAGLAPLHAERLAARGGVGGDGIGGGGVGAP